MTAAAGSSRLQIRLKKAKDGPPVLTCVREDGSRTWSRLQAFFPAHDLLHCAVESTLGLRPVTDAELNLVRRRHQDLLFRWRTFPQGDTLEIELPLSPEPPGGP